MSNLLKNKTELKFSDIFSAATLDEVVERRKNHSKSQIKLILDKVKKTKLPDGTWHIHSDLNLSSCDYLMTLKEINVSIIDGNLKIPIENISNVEEMKVICKVKGNVDIIW